MAHHRSWRPGVTAVLLLVAHPAATVRRVGSGTHELLHLGEGLSCGAEARASSLFAAENRGWTAGQVIASVEALRKELRVPFYMY